MPRRDLVCTQAVARVTMSSTWTFGTLYGFRIFVLQVSPWVGREGAGGGGVVVITIYINCWGLYGTVHL